MRRAPSLAALTLLVDRGAPALFDNAVGAKPEDDAAAHYIYVDNVGVLSTSEDRVRRGLEEASHRLDAAGLETHEHEISSSEAVALGCWLDGRRGLTRMTLERFLRLRRGLDFVLHCRRLPGTVWRILAGHMTWAALLRRDLLCTFSALYPFIEKHLSVAAPLWPSARREVEFFRGLDFRHG